MSGLVKPGDGDGGGKPGWLGGPRNDLEILHDLHFLGRLKAGEPAEQGAVRAGDLERHGEVGAMGSGLGFQQDRGFGIEAAFPRRGKQLLQKGAVGFARIIQMGHGGVQPGLPFLPERSVGGRGHGDHHVHVEVTVPQKLSQEQEELLRELAESFGESVSEKKGFFRSLRKRKR